MNKGVVYGLGAYLLWGIFPIYFKLISSVPATQILAHRIVWSFLLLIGILLARKELSGLLNAARRPRISAIYLVTGLLLSVNWGAYIWGVNSGYIVETSLGYFINPLVNVLLGVVFLRERLRPIQWVPISLAAAGVGYMTLSYGRLPWIALVLGFTFGTYGLLKKVAPLNSLNGLTMETGAIFLPAVAFLVWTEVQGAGALKHTTASVNALLLLSGLATTIPLLMFGAAVRSIPLSLLGLLQYIAPTCQFLIGVLLYGEPFDRVRVVGFSLIWIALVLLWTEGMITRRRMKLKPELANP